jgi:cellulose synthase/poly-beta-1,6-N-acetylglucosamine synthase-like glycosyltransferase
MTDLYLIYLALLLVFGLAYLFIIGMYTLGWFRLKTFLLPANSYSTRLSIIIPSRDEEANILHIIEDIAEQDYPKNLFEVFIVDDNSGDATPDIVNNFILHQSSLQIKLINIAEDNPNSAYKKKAISLAIEVATGDLIITTDADCRMGKQWLSSIAGFYESVQPKMIVGPVSFHNEQSYFEKMQTVEFLSLIGITAGAISIGRPIMCNGANLAYEKSSFYDVGGFGDDNFSSGDDVFLLLKLKKHFGNKSVGFLKNENAFVFTEAKKNFREFLHQRIRWASKNKGYDLKILMVSFTVFMMNFLLVVGLIWGIFNTKSMSIILVLYLLKLVLEVPILLGIVSFAHRSRMLLCALPLIFLYPVYIIFTGTMGIIASYQWKGRTVKR